MSGGGAKVPKSTEQTTTSIPKFAEPYAMSMLGRAQSLMEQGAQYGMPTYGEQRIAGFSPMQEQAFMGLAGMQPSAQLGQATQLSGLAGLQAALMAQQGYQPGTFYGPNLYNYQMGPAERVGTYGFNEPGVAGEYMSPYMQNVVDRQQQEAIRQAGIANAQQGYQAATSGAFGGTRQALQQAEAARNLGGQLQDIQARGLQSAYEQAAQQFQQDQARRLQAQMANQAAGLTTGQQNLAALLGVQQLGANLGMQGQQLAEQSRQFGAGYGLDALSRQLAAAQQLGALGTDQYNQQMGILGAQEQAGAKQQALEQQVLSQQYQDFLNQLNYPYKQMGFMSDILRGLPTQQSSTLYTAPGSTAGQLSGLLGGLGALYLGGG